jgi:hypothetical protein
MFVVFLYRSCDNLEPNVSFSCELAGVLMKIVSLLKYPELPPYPIITAVTFGSVELKLLAITNENRSTRKRPNRLLILIEI